MKNSRIMTEVDWINAVTYLSARDNSWTWQVKQVWRTLIDNTLELQVIYWILHFLFLVITNINFENKYMIKNSMGQQVYFAKEREYSSRFYISTLCM